MISIKLNGKYVAPKGQVVCEWCKCAIEKGQWVKNNYEFGIFHEDCHDEYMANEFPYTFGVWGDDVTEEDV